jgi:hypothetical protein
MNRIIQGLWIGESLSAIERLSIASFVANGHEFDLYVYGPISGLPEGGRLRDANEILPRDCVFRYRDQPSYAGFANFFRYRLLLERGGWWVDLDAVCIRPFDFEDDFVFSSEHDRLGRRTPNAAFIKAPPRSAIMSELWDVCQAKDPARLEWGETGSRLLREALPRFGLEANVRESCVFCPIGYSDWERLVAPEETWSFPDSTRAVHLWNEMWRRGGRDKDASYHPDCLFERLKARYNVRPSTVS